MGKSPAFQLYVNDFLGSAKVQMMCGHEVGVYFLLLLLDWQEIGFEFDPPMLARWCRVDEPVFNQAWKLVGRCFKQRDGKMFNPRLELEREKQLAWSEKSRKGGLANAQRWLKGPSRVVEPQGSTPFPFPSPSEQQQQQLSSAAPTSEPGTALVTVQRQPLELTPQAEAVRSKTARRKTVEGALKLGSQVVFSYWRDVMHHPGAILDQKRETRIIARLRENGGDVSELLYVVDGALRDDWTMGRDPRSSKLFDGTETIFKSREKCEALLALVRDRADTHPYLEASDANG